MSEQCNGFTCPVEATISLIGGKYKAVILWHLMNNTLQYSELHRKIPKATDKMLAQQLAITRIRKRWSYQPYGLPCCATKDRIQSFRIWQALQFLLFQSPAFALVCVLLSALFSDSLYAPLWQYQQPG